jgi:Cytochrome P460
MHAIVKRAAALPPVLRCAKAGATCRPPPARPHSATPRTDAASVCPTTARATAPHAHHTAGAADMRHKTHARAALVATAFALAGGITLAQQDRYSLKVPDGLSFAEIRGYDGWQTIAVSSTETGIKAILGNAAMIKAYHDGIPGNGKPFPEGVKVVKIEWVKKKNDKSPYFVEVPDTLKSVSFIVKDSKRFPNTHGWAYGQFAYAADKTFKPSVSGSECGYACHTTVASQDYIFTAYPPR